MLIDQKKKKKNIGDDDWNEKKRNKERTRRTDCRKVPSSRYAKREDGGMGETFLSLRQTNIYRGVQTNKQKQKKNGGKRV